MSTLHAALFLAALSATSQDPALQRALECQEVSDSLDQVLAQLSVPLDGSEVRLSAPVTVYGRPVQRVAVFRDGGTDLYTSWIEGVPLRDVAHDAGLASEDDAFYMQTTALGSLTLTPDGDAAMLRCTVDFY